MCKFTGSGCNHPDGECAGLCLATPIEVGAKLVDRETGEAYSITEVGTGFVAYQGDAGNGRCRKDAVHEIFEVRHGS